MIHFTITTRHHVPGCRKCNHIGTCIHFIHPNAFPQVSTRCIQDTWCNLFLCFTTQLLTFLVFNNQVCNGDLNKSIASVYDMTAGISCDLSKDAYLAISAAVFFLGLGILITICPTPEKSISQALCGSCSCCSDEQQGQQIHPQEADDEKKNTGDISGVQGTPSFSYSV